MVWWGITGMRQVQSHSDLKFSNKNEQKHQSACGTVTKWTGLCPKTLCSPPRMKPAAVPLNKALSLTFFSRINQKFFCQQLVWQVWLVTHRTPFVWTAAIIKKAQGEAAEQPEGQPPPRGTNRGQPHTQPHALCYHILLITFVIYQILPISFMLRVPLTESHSAVVFNNNWSAENQIGWNPVDLRVTQRSSG